MYKVITRFADLEDRNHIYEVGDVYPREGYQPTKKSLDAVSHQPTQDRIDFLASDKNKLGTPVIEFVPDAEEAEAEEVTAKKAGKKSSK